MECIGILIARLGRSCCSLRSSAPTLQRSIWCLGIIIICVIMKQVEMNQNSRLTPHFKLGELCKTKYVTADGNIPSRAVIENLIRVCGWLEELRVVAGVRPRSKVGCAVVAGVRPQSKVASDCTLAPDPWAAPELGGAPYSRNENTGGEAIVINSGYRSPEVNRLAGGVPSSNHVTGCAVDIRCAGKEQMIRYAAILLDIADETKRDFDELLLEQHGSVCWLHFAVRPKDNRRKIAFLKV